MLMFSTSGWAADSFTNPDSSSGNVVFLRNFMDGELPTALYMTEPEPVLALLIQPCNPTFVQARDAWVQADINRYGGAHQCTILKEFASRGLGVNAANFVNDFSVPDICGGTPSTTSAVEEPTSSSPPPTGLANLFKGI
ncbi:hypothetical protein FRC19_007461 [Serendipita sp. 401]|nr:hypothetical protein FRC19_007461 [Serendipita sp. 401]